MVLRPVDRERVRLISGLALRRTFVDSCRPRGRTGTRSSILADSRRSFFAEETLAAGLNQGAAENMAEISRFIRGSVRDLPKEDLLMSVEAQADLDGLLASGRVVRAALDAMAAAARPGITTAS